MDSNCLLLLAAACCCYKTAFRFPLVLASRFPQLPLSRYAVLLRDPHLNSRLPLAVYYEYIAFISIYSYMLLSLTWPPVLGIMQYFIIKYTLVLTAIIIY